MADARVAEGPRPVPSRAGTVTIGLVRPFLRLLLALVLCGGLVHIGGPARGELAVIAAPLSLSGHGAGFGQATLAGLRFAVEEAQKADPNLRIRVDGFDDRGNPAEARAIAERVAAGPAAVAIGPSFAAAAVAAAPIYAGAGLAVLPPTVTPDVISGYPTMFRVVFGNVDQGAMLAHYLVRALRQKRAVAIVVPGPYGDTLRQGFARTAAGLGMQVRSFELAPEPDDDDVSDLAAMITDGEPGAVLLLMHDWLGARVLTKLRRLGHPGPFLGPDAFSDDSFNRLFADEPEERAARGYFTHGVYALAPVIMDSAHAAMQGFAQRFAARFGYEPTWQAVAGYDAGRVAVQAIQQAALTHAGDRLAQRKAALAFIRSLDGPGRSVAGLLGPFWAASLPERRPPIRIGRFRGAVLESAPQQIVDVARYTDHDLEKGEVFPLGPGRLGRIQHVVYTGIHLNEIPRIDVARGTFSADFFLWLRFSGSAAGHGADSTELIFPSQLDLTFDQARPVDRHTHRDGTEYRLWRIQGEFRNRFDLHRFPFDSQTLSLPFAHKTAAADRIVYVIDRNARSDPGASVSMGHPIISDQAFRVANQWTLLGASERREAMVTRSTLGHPDQSASGERELSGFVVTVDLRRRSLMTLVKMLLPLLIMSLITLAALCFPRALVKEKITVTVTGALAGTVLLTAINSQLDTVGYTLAIEWVFYLFFMMALLSIVAVLGAEQLRLAGRPAEGMRVDHAARTIYAILTVIAVTTICILAMLP